MRDAASSFSSVPLAQLIQKGRKITYGIVQPGEFVEDGVILVRGRDYSSGWRDLSGFMRVTPEIDAPYKRSKLKSGDLVLTIVGANTGTVAVVPAWLEGANITQTTARIAVDPMKAVPDYVEQFLRSAIGQEAVYRFQKGGAQPGLNLADVEKFEIPVPPIPEQHCIANVLRTWDEALENLSALHAAKDQRLVGLRAALLFGELRLNGQRRNWAPTRLGAVTHELTKRNGAKGLGRDFVMGVTKAEGVVPMREQTIAGDISRYKRLPPRAFAYNPMRINVGSIAMNEREDEVLVSPDYVVFACNADGLDPDYLDHLRKTSWWAHYINSGGSGSVRQRTYYDDLAALKLPLPELDEQKAIASVLNTARADLAATGREIEAVTLQKRGLMQKLLTGEWRVPLDPSERSAATEETEHAG